MRAKTQCHLQQILSLIAMAVPFRDCGSEVESTEILPLIKQEFIGQNFISSFHRYQYGPQH